MLRASAADRNKVPIASVLVKYLQNRMKVLEISSGTGQHVIHFASLFPEITFQPSEVDIRSLHSIVGYIDHYRYSNVRVPLFIDVSRPINRWALPEDFGPHEVDVILNINMLHICSNDAIDGLFKSAGTLLKYGTGLLITYGPYAINGDIYPQSNIDFNEYLRNQNDEWGLRDVKILEQNALRNGMHMVARHEMPANNHMLIFCKDSQ